jgi:hypothetical protein
MAKTHAVLHHTHPLLGALLPERLRGPGWFRMSVISYGELYVRTFFLFSLYAEDASLFDEAQRIE